MIVYTCDNCGKEFGGPLDRIVHDKEGYDLCAPCRKIVDDGKKQVDNEFFGKIKVEKGKNK